MGLASRDQRFAYGWVGSGLIRIDTKLSYSVSIVLRQHTVLYAMTLINEHFPPNTLLIYYFGTCPRIISSQFYPTAPPLTTSFPTSA